jgi:uridine kinase
VTARRQPPVIAVAGPVGAGKSTLVQALAARLGGCQVVAFDDYERLTERPVVDARRWLADGATADDIPVPGLLPALESLKRGDSAARFVLFETQFGRLHGPTGRLIDFLVWIDTPLDVALARKVRQFCASATPGPAGAAFVRWLEGYLENYCTLVADLLRVQRDRVRPAADLVLTGLEPVEVQVARVLGAMDDASHAGKGNVGRFPPENS